MNSDANLVFEVWEAVRDYIPAARRTDVATLVLRCFEDYGFERGDLSHLVDEDDNLTAAFKVVFSSDEEEEEEDGYDPYE